MEQFTKETAIKFYESKVWEHMTDAQIVELQLFQKLICVPFTRFDNALENVLGRQVSIPELMTKEGVERLKAEFFSKRQMEGLREILDMIPADKRMVIFSEQLAN